MQKRRERGEEEVKNKFGFEKKSRGGGCVAILFLCFFVKYSKTHPPPQNPKIRRKK